MHWPTRSAFYLTASTVLAGLFLAWGTFYYLNLSTAPTVTPSASSNKVLTANFLNSLSSNFKLSTPQQVYEIKPETFKGWFEAYYRAYTDRQELRPNFEKIADFVTSLETQVETTPVNARIAFDKKTGQLYESVPAVYGKKIAIDRSVANIFSAFYNQQTASQLVFMETAPAVTQEKLRQLGITERIAVGQSNFAGSPNPRIHNIKTGAKTFNGLVVENGENFSFNDHLGEVTASTGYQPELVIKNKKIIPEYGGGLCQVSTTLFRAATLAGLPITERRPHALPVRYYNPQGFDATIYPGVTDLKFKNDTGYPLYLQTEVRGATISFEIYGTGDGRKVKIDGPHIYESNPDGSMKTWLKQIVTTKDGQERKNTFWSWYKSPALYPIVRDPLE